IVFTNAVEHERLVEAYSAVNQKLQHSLHEEASLERTIQEQKADLRRHERDYSLAQKEIADLQREITVLLKECRDIQLRCGSTGYDLASDNMTAPFVQLNAFDADDLTFKDINGLVEQNVQLRSLVRSLSDQIENKEVELKEKFEKELQKHSDEAASKVDAVLARAEEQGQMIESLHTSVAMYKRLYEEEHKHQASYAFPQNTSSVLLSVAFLSIRPFNYLVVTEGRNGVMLLLEDSQETGRKAQAQASARLKSLEEDLERLRNEIISLRSQRDKLALEASFAQEKLDRFMRDFDHQRDETNGVIARNVEFSQLIIDYQRKLREGSESAQAAEELSRKLTMEVSILKHEKQMLLNSEKRACDEVRSLSERVYRLQATLDTIQSAEEVREEARATESRKQEDYIKKIEREWAEAKSELLRERDNVRNLTLDRESAMKSAMRQVEEMGKELANGLHALAGAEARAALAEARCSDLEKKIKSLETKVYQKDDASGPSPSSANEAVADLHTTKEEIEKLREEAQVNKDHMLQYKGIAQVNEAALKQMEVAYENFKLEADKVKEKLEAELLSLRERVNELEKECSLKTKEAVSAAAGKEEALASAVSTIASLKEESSVKMSEIMVLETQISTMKSDLEKEHQRWQTAQANYERQVILQSETIQELTKTSQALASLQDDASDLRKLADTLKTENEDLKSKLDTEISVLEKLKIEAERKYNEIDEQVRREVIIDHLKEAKSWKRSLNIVYLGKDTFIPHDQNTIASPRYILSMFPAPDLSENSETVLEKTEELNVSNTGGEDVLGSKFLVRFSSKNKILHSRLEAFHIKLAEKDRDSGTKLTGSIDQDKLDDAGLQNVVSYLRRSKEIGETEISLLKQEKLRLQAQVFCSVTNEVGSLLCWDLTYFIGSFVIMVSNVGLHGKLESALKAAEMAQASLRAERANSRAFLFTEEEFKSLQLQVREMNLLRESNIQLREENKHNFDECQKLHEVAQKARIRTENLETLLGEREAEVDACKREIEMQKIEREHLGKRVDELLERCKNIDVEDYNRMSAEVQQLQAREHTSNFVIDEQKGRESLFLLNILGQNYRGLVKVNARERDAQLDELKKLVSEKEDVISQLEQDLARCRVELKERETRINSLLQVEASLKSDIEKKQKLIAQLKKRSENLLKEKEEQSKEIQALSKQLEDSRQGKRVVVDAAGEADMREKEMEKDTRIQMLEKIVEKVRDDLRKQKDDHKAKRKIVENSYQSTVQDKLKFEDEFKKHKQALQTLSDEVEKLQHAKSSQTEGSSVVQILSGTPLEDFAAAYLLAVQNFDKVVHSLFSESGASTPADNSSAVDASLGGEVVPPLASSLAPPVAPAPGVPSARVAEDTRKRIISGKPNVETRRFGRKLIRPHITRPEEPPVTDVDMSEIEGPKNAANILSTRNAETQLSVRKRPHVSSTSELQQESIVPQVSSSDAASPVLKKSKALNSQQEAVELQPARDPEIPENLPAAEESGVDVGNSPHGLMEEAKDEAEPTGEQAEARQVDGDRSDIGEESLDGPNGVEVADDWPMFQAEQDIQHPVGESGSDHEEGELVPDTVDREGGEGPTEAGEFEPEQVAAPARPSGVEEEPIPAAPDTGGISSIQILDDKTDEVATTEEVAEGTSDQVVTETEQDPEAGLGAGGSVPEDVSTPGSPIVPEAKQASPVGSSSTTINLPARARQRAALRQAGRVPPPVNRGRASRGRGRGRGREQG
ncbi:hypothetical protein RJ639_030686, partial [Escallonia herrerae]